jgi:transposase
METERIELSARERERLKVLQQVEEGHLQQVEAARRLRLSDRQVRRLQQRWRQEGDGGIVHRLRGRRSNRKIPDAARKRAITELRQARYAGFGPTLAGEHLSRAGLVASRETLRQWMVAAGLWQARRRQGKRVHVWRPRRCCRGELVMMDSSPFAWLEQRGPRCHLIAMIDDATSQAWGRLVEHDSTEENLRTLGSWLQRYGRPLALYTDKNSLFVTSRPVQWHEQSQNQPARTQFGRALAELDIEWIAAHSPQAKGRIERLFGTLQDRLVKEMRLAEIATLEAANRFLEITFWPFWNQRFAVTPARSGDAHRRLERNQRWRKSSACGWCGPWAPTTRWCGTGSAGALGASRWAPGCVGRTRQSKSGSTAPTGCVSAAVICRCSCVRPRRDRQALPAYGLQALPIARPNQKLTAKPNTFRLPIIPGASPGSGHF